MKRIFSIFLILIMSLTFVACGNKSIEEEIVGNWIYTESENTYIINFTTDSFKMTMISGNYDDFFEYDGDYSINKDENTILLSTDTSEELELEYIYEDKELYLNMYDEATFEKTTEYQVEKILYELATEK